MANTQKYLNHLLQNTGITPACSEEERIAANDIAQIFRAHGFEPQVQEFTAGPNGKTGAIVLGIALFLGTLLSAFGGVALVIGLLLILACSVLYALERTGRPTFSRLGSSGLSQNVIAYHKAEGPLASPRNRPVVVVAHYDSPRAELLSQMPYAQYRGLLQKVYPIAVFVPLAVVILRFFPLPGAVKVVLWIVALLAALVPLFFAIAHIVEKAAMPYTSGSVCNKSSVAAMLGVMDAVAPYGEGEEFPNDEPFEEWMGEQRSMAEATAQAAASYASGEDGGVSPAGADSDAPEIPRADTEEAALLGGAVATGAAAGVAAGAAAEAAEAAEVAGAAGVAAGAAGAAKGVGEAAKGAAEAVGGAAKQAFSKLKGLKGLAKFGGAADEEVAVDAVDATDDAETVDAADDASFEAYDESAEAPESFEFAEDAEQPVADEYAEAEEVQEAELPVEESSDEFVAEDETPAEEPVAEDEDSFDAASIVEAAAAAAAVPVAAEVAQEFAPEDEAEDESTVEPELTNVFEAVTEPEAEAETVSESEPVDESEPEPEPEPEPELIEIEYEEVVEPGIVNAAGNVRHGAEKLASLNMLPASCAIEYDSDAMPQPTVRTVTETITRAEAIEMGLDLGDVEDDAASDQGLFTMPTTTNDFYGVGAAYGDEELTDSTSAYDSEYEAEEGPSVGEKISSTFSSFGESARGFFGRLASKAKGLVQKDEEPEEQLEEAVDGAEDFESVDDGFDAAADTEFESAPVEFTADQNADVTAAGYGYGNATEYQEIPAGSTAPFAPVSDVNEDFDALGETEIFEPLSAANFFNQSSAEETPVEDEAPVEEVAEVEEAPAAEEVEQTATFESLPSEDDDVIEAIYEPVDDEVAEDAPVESAPVEEEPVVSAAEEPEPEAEPVSEPVEEPVAAPVEDELEPEPELETESDFAAEEPASAEPEAETTAAFASVVDDEPLDEASDSSDEDVTASIPVDPEATIMAPALNMDEPGDLSDDLDATLKTKPVKSNTAEVEAIMREISPSSAATSTKTRAASKPLVSVPDPSMPSLQQKNTVSRSSLFDLPDPGRENDSPFGKQVAPQTTAPASAESEKFEVLTAEAPKAKKKKKLFGKKKKEEESMSQLLGLDDNFDAKSSGRSIGSWDNFEESDNNGNWKGGAVSSDDSVSEEDMMSAVASMGDDELLGHDIWFVAAGASENDNAGVKAFLAEHRKDLRGVFVINLESVGAGQLSMIASEGENRVLKGDRRIMRLVNTVASTFHKNLPQVDMPYLTTDAYPARAMSLRSVTIAGVDGPRLACSHTTEDVPHIVDESNVATAAEIVTEVIRRS